MVIFRARPGADQALAVAHGIDRERGAAAADDGSKPRACRASRSGNRAKKDRIGCLIRPGAPGHERTLVNARYRCRVKFETRCGRIVRIRGLLKSPRTKTGGKQ